MNDENIIISGSPIEIAEFGTYKLATFLISVLDEFDLNGRMIPKEAGEAYHASIRGFPIVAKLIYDYAGNPIDFRGHEMMVVRDRDGNLQAKFGTTPIGSVINSWVEDRVVDGYNGVKSCIMIQAKLWSDRYPEYFKVLDKLWAANKVKSSWEIKSSEVEQLPLGKKILKVFSFVGNALLGSNVEGAVPGAGVYEYAELGISDDDYALAEALSNDLSVESKTQDKNEGGNLKKKTDEIAETADETQTEVVPEVDINETSEAVAVETEPVVQETEKTDGNGTCEDETHAEEITISEPPTQEDLSSVITNLKQEVSEKTDALVKANETIQTLQAEIESMKPFKEAAEKAEHERIETETAEKRKSLSEYAQKSGFINVSEIEDESSDVHKAIAELNQDSIKNIIATRFMDSLNNTSTEVEHEVATVSERETEVAAIIDSDDEVQTTSIVKLFLNK